ncbi:MAG: c-type cytochrome [Rhodocyclales bacterium]|nr:c-type cytochrome [Rhodocyclales bacterium]
MNFGILDIAGIGAVALLIAAAVLLPMVHVELGPSGRLAGKGRWLLAMALGMGVLAFAFKLAAIVSISTLPQVIIAPLLRGASQALPESAAIGADQFNVLTAAAQPAYVWEALPLSAPYPADNPTTPEKVALGERLFHDKALSRDRKLACASCHDVQRGAGTDRRATSLGIDGQVGSRNAPTVWNAAFQSVLFWDGRAPSLEEQAKGPPVNPAEMGMPSLDAVARRVADDPSYRAPFARAFGPGTAITIERIAAAIAAYERTLITPDAPYDRFVRGDATALSAAQLRGMALFQSTGCIGCHSGPNFSGASLFDPTAPLRVFPANATAFDARYGLTRDSGLAPAGSGRGIWRVPSLRNVALTAPYFHNGSVDDLAEAVRIMASAQVGRRTRDDPDPGRYVVWSPPERVLSSVDRSALTDQQVDDIVAFLRSLSSATLAAARQPGA